MWSSNTGGTSGGSFGSGGQKSGAGRPPGAALPDMTSPSYPGARTDAELQAIIEVDEKGTTAAAATGISVGTTSLPTTLVVDRPFLFFIRHNPTGAILFQGRVVDPSK